MSNIGKDYLLNKKHIHFIGIGGSGMFPLVQILHQRGFFITGSDNNHTDTIDALIGMGIEVFLAQTPENLKSADLIVYTTAILDDNPELMTAKNIDVDLIERSLLLGLLSKEKDNAICISGTHGKTTCTSMIASILLGCEMDPTCVIGGKLQNLNISGRVGESDNIVIEACEFKNTFLQLHPDIGVILNIDEDHLDYFKTIDNIILSFKKFAGKVTKFLVMNKDDVNCRKCAKNLDKKIIWFGSDETCDYYAKNVRNNVNGFLTEYDLCDKNGFVMRISLNVPGEHNVKNSLAALSTCLQMTNNKDAIYKSLSQFKGAKRRFEILGNINGVTIADDYAHHPVEIDTTLRAAKTMGFNKICVIHQPFTYTRTHTFLNEFARTLSLADNVILTDIMGAREKNTIGIKVEDLSVLIDGCKVIKDFNEAGDFAIKNANNGDLIITMGCGDANKISNYLINRYS